VATKHIARFQIITQQPVDEKFIAVDLELFFIIIVGGVKVTPVLFSDEMPGELIRFVLG